MDAQATFSVSFTQCDLNPPVESPDFSSLPAQKLLPSQRQDLAVQALAGAEPVTDLARQHQVSRKFVYEQVHTAEQALDGALTPVQRPTTSSSTGPSPEPGCANWFWRWC